MGQHLIYGHCHPIHGQLLLELIPIQLQLLQGMLVAYYLLLQVAMDVQVRLSQSQLLLSQVHLLLQIVLIVKVQLQIVLLVTLLLLTVEL